MAELITVLTALALVVSALGVIVPVLPGSLLAMVALLLWALLLPGANTVIWIAALSGMLVVLVAWSCSAILTGRTLRQRNIPRGPILLGIAGAIIGMFLLPVVGIFLGFAAGLFIGEAIRHRAWRSALSSTWAALKAMGLGVVCEFFGVCLAGSAFTIGSLIYFVT